MKRHEKILFLLFHPRRRILLRKPKKAQLGCSIDSESPELFAARFQSKSVVRRALLLLLCWEETANAKRAMARLLDAWCAALCSAACALCITMGVLASCLRGGAAVYWSVNVIRVPVPEYSFVRVCHTWYLELLYFTVWQWPPS